MRPFFLTTAIDYTNGAPHIGHAYEKVLADVLARYQRLRGREVFFLTGVDQHGQKVQQSAEKAGLAPADFVAEITEKFRALWTKLDVAYDGWAATVEPAHKAVVQTLLQRLFDEGQLYRATQRGFYSVRQEQFLTEKERGPDGAFGAEWGEVVEIEEENYYFRLAEHRDWLLGYIDAHPAFITPEFRRVELRNAVEKLTGDLCISRPKSRLAWGIELPFDPDFVTYVWFDALVNYLSFAPGFDPHSTREHRDTATRSAAGREAPRPPLPASSPPRVEFTAYWPALHVIGKDILVPAHGVYWPIMLHALGFADDEIPSLLVHGWWNISGAKMSKSLGNVVDPYALADRYGAPALRYYLMADIATGQDADFSEDRLVSRYNVDLANGFGNLLNRTLTMAHRYRAGALAPIAEPDEDVQTLRAENFNDAALYRERFDQYRVHQALEAFAAIVTRANVFVDAAAPWKLAKDPTAAHRLDQVLTALVESVRLAATLLLPVAPDKARAALAQLQLPAAPLDVPAPLDAPHQLGAPEPLFPRIDVPAPVAAER